MNQKNDFAPIIIFAYKRLEELKMVVDALKTCEEAKDSALYVFIDGAKKEEDKKTNERIVAYSKSITGFKTVEVEASKENKGLANSVIYGVTKVINKYGRAIVVEDDIIVSNSFLKYMNECLDFYENEKNVFSLSGYCPDIKINNDRVFFFPRIESWGWATWKNRWEKVDWEVSDFNELSKDEKRIKEFNRGGNDLYKMLKMQMEGKVDSWAIRYCYCQFLNRQYTVVPPKSLVNNIGFGNNGTNCYDKTNRFDTKINNDYVPELVPFTGKLENYKRTLNFYNGKVGLLDIADRAIKKIGRLLGIISK